MGLWNLRKGPCRMPLKSLKYPEYLIHDKQDNVHFEGRKESEIERWNKRERKIEEERKAERLFHPSKNVVCHSISFILSIKHLTRAFHPTRKLGQLKYMLRASDFISKKGVKMSSAWMTFNPFPSQPPLCTLDDDIINLEYVYVVR